MKVEKLLELKKKMEIIIADYISRLGEEYSNENKDMNILCPVADIYEDDSRQIIFLETPALKTSSVNCSVQNNSVIFRGEKESQIEKPRKYLHMERSEGSYFKAVPLISEKAVTKIEHNYKYGVLKIIVHFGAIQ